MSDRQQVLRLKGVDYGAPTWTARGIQIRGLGRRWCIPSRRGAGGRCIPTSCGNDENGTIAFCTSAPGGMRNTHPMRHFRPRTTLVLSEEELMAWKEAGSQGGIRVALCTAEIIESIIFKIRTAIGRDYSSRDIDRVDPMMLRCWKRQIEDEAENS